MLKKMTAKLIDVAPTVNPVVYREEKEKEVETKVGSQANFLLYPNRLAFIQLSASVHPSLYTIPL